MASKVVHYLVDAIIVLAVFGILAWIITKFGSIAWELTKRLFQFE